MGQPEQALNYAQQASAISGGVDDRNTSLPPAPLPVDRRRIWRVNSDIGQPQPLLRVHQQALPIFTPPYSFPP